MCIIGFMRGKNSKTKRSKIRAERRRPGSVRTAQGCDSIHSAHPGVNFMDIPIKIRIGGEVVVCSGTQLQKAIDNVVLDVIHQPKYSFAFIKKAING